MRIRPAALALLAASLPLSIHAQDLAGMAGSLKVNSTHERTFVGAISYTQPVGNYNAVSLSYINEGHPEDHHRDGMAGLRKWPWLRCLGSPYMRTVFARAPCPGHFSGPLGPGSLGLSRGGVLDVVASWRLRDVCLRPKVEVQSHQAWPICASWSIRYRVYIHRNRLRFRSKM